MNIVQLTEGAGDRFTSTGIRDQALVAALRRIGHRVTYVRLWNTLPQEEPESWQHPVFFYMKDYALYRYSFLYRNVPGLIPPVIREHLAKRATKKTLKLTPAGKTKLNIDLLRFEHHYFEYQYKALLNAIKHAHPDIICLSSMRFAKLIPKLKADLGVPVVASLTGSLCNWMRTGILKNKELTNRLHDAFSAADRIIAPSKYLARSACVSLKLAESSISIVPTGLMLNNYNVRELIPPDPTIGFIGGPAESNGMSHLLEAMQHLADKGIEFKFLAAGNMSERGVAKFKKYLKPIFRNAPDNFQVFPTLSIGDKINILEQTTVLTLPGKRKAFGNPVIEALASGVPVVVPDAGPYPEILGDADVGLLYDPTIPGAYTEALEKLLLDREYNKACGQRARAEAINRFSSERMAGDVLDVLNSLLS